MKVSRLQLQNSAGFSVTELLILIAVVALIAGMAIPTIDVVTQSPVDARRNAQSVVSVYQSGYAAGVEWTGATRNAKIESVIVGQAPTNGTFAGKTFRVPNLRGPDKTACYRYIGSDASGDLFYDKTGGQPAS
jgi:hypothetical protein